MRKRPGAFHPIVGAVVAALLGCAVPPASALPPPANSPDAGRAESISADSPHLTTTGNTFTAPKDWQLHINPEKVVLVPPERDSRLALVDVQASDADEAVRKAWVVFRPDSKRSLRLSTAQAPREGWEEIQDYQYETSPNERLAVFATARRAGSAWAVSVVEVTLPTLGKRGSQISLVLQSLRPKGYQRETFADRKPHPLDRERIETLKRFVTSGMQQLGIPGLAFSLIDGGKVVYQGGLGVRQLGRPERVDADSLFIAASNTKALTTLLLARLVDEHKLRWDEPVIEAYPSFKLGDAETTRRVLVKHLVCACTGMPRQDLEWVMQFKHGSASSTMKLLGEMQPTSQFGDLFQYSNVMVAAAGYVAASMANPDMELGAAYDKAMRTEIFGPLGMLHTTFDFATAQSDNYARPHGDDPDGKPTLARMELNYSAVPIRPAAAMWTSVRDLSMYVRMELARGRLPDGRQFISEENLLARRVPQVMVSEDVYYGMGLVVDRRWGIPVIHHGGDLAGYHSDMMWLPDQGVGAVILTNGDYGWALPGPFLRRLVELIFDGKSEAEAQLRSHASDRAADTKVTRQRLVIPADKSQAAQLAIRYNNPRLGALIVGRDAQGVTFNFGDLHSKVASRNNDDGTTSFVTIDPTLSGLNFVVAEREGKRSLILRDAQHEYVYLEESK